MKFHVYKYSTVLWSAPDVRGKITSTIVVYCYYHYTYYLLATTAHTRARTHTRTPIHGVHITRSGEEAVRRESKMFVTKRSAAPERCRTRTGCSQSSVERRSLACARAPRRSAEFPAVSVSYYYYQSRVRPRTALAFGFCLPSEADISSPIYELLI